VGSNVIVRDGGIEGVVIRLGRGFTQMDTMPLPQPSFLPGREGERSERDVLAVRVGAASLDVNVAHFAAQHELTGLEFLCGIPGTIGGALAMNAGAYGCEIKDVLIEAEAVDPQGRMHRLGVEALGYRYRHCGLPAGWIFTAALLAAEPGERAAIEARMAEIGLAREATQPVRMRTGGSTFKNPPQAKAWQMIDEAGARGMMLGSAQVSEKHCNFLINTGQATAAELEALGDAVIDRVKARSGITLEWEIKRIGKKISR